MLITTEFANRAKPIEKVIDAVNYTFQSVLKAHNLGPQEGVLLEELCCRGDQLSGVVVVGWRVTLTLPPAHTMVHYIYTNSQPSGVFRPYTLHRTPKS